MISKFIQKISNSIHKLVYDYRSFEIVELSEQSIFHIYEIFDFKGPVPIRNFDTYEECLDYIEKIYESSILKDYKIESSIDIVSKIETFKVLYKFSNKDVTEYIIRGEFYSYEDALQNLKIYFKNIYTFKIKKI